MSDDRTLHGCVWLTGNRTLESYDDTRASARVVDHEHTCGNPTELRIQLRANAISGEIEDA